MMLTIHGLPAVANHQDVRTLLQRECNLTNFILDNLVHDKNNTKKVRIGVADETEGAHVIKCLDGFRCGGKVLYVIPVLKSPGPPNAPPQAYNPQGNFQGNDYPPPLMNQYIPPDQMDPRPGTWNQDQWAGLDQPMVEGYGYPQQNMPFQQQPQPTQRPLNERELMLQATRGPAQESFRGRPSNVPKQNPIPPPSRPALRNIETVDLPKGGPDRFQTYEQPKPITIKKDNFMGPDQFLGNSNPQGPYPQGHSQSSVWMNQGPQSKPGFGKSSQAYEDDKKFPPKAGILKNPIDREKYNDKPGFSPQRRDSPGRRASPHRAVSPGRRMPPTNDRIHPNDRTGPNDRRMPIDDRMGPKDRRMPIKDDRMGPNDRRMPINDDRMGPNDRRGPMIDDRVGPNDRRGPMNDDRMGPNDRRMPMNDDRMGPNDRRGPMNDDRMGPNDRRGPMNDDRMGPNDRRGPMNDDRMGPNDRRGPMNDDRMGPNDRRGPINDDRMGPNDSRGPMNDDRKGPNDRRMPINDRMGPNDRRMPMNDDRIGPHDRRVPLNDRMGPNDRRMPMNDDRLGPNDRRMRLNDDRMGSNDRRMPIDDRMPINDRKMPLNDNRMGPNYGMMPKDDRMGPIGPNSGNRLSPSGRRMSPPRRISPPGRRMSPPGRRMSPPGKRMSPPGRRISPSGRRMSPPGRRMSPSGRRLSPPGRRMSPSGRRMSPSGRRISPSDKRISPDRRMRSPGRRSPNRRLSPESHTRSMRYSPGRHPDKDRLKQVRPAYEPDHKAANQAMYSGGFRPNVHEPYRAVPGAERISPWQDSKYGKKEEDLRKDLILSRVPELEKRISPRASRSPHRRSRSPLRDRYRRHSPSPRSPRRSWALEKRRSPEQDAPPPPAWPGQPQEYPRSTKEEKTPVWETRNEKIDDFQPDTIRVRKDLMLAREVPRWEPSQHRVKEDRRDDRYRETKFERNDYHDRFPEPDRKKLPDREEFIARSERAHEQFKKKEESPKRQLPLDQYRKKHDQIEEEFQDIYQRAVDFAKKSHELRKLDRRKDEERHDERREFFDRHREEDRPRSRHSDEYRKRQPEWEIDPRKRLDPNNLAKREKAADEISRRIIQKYINLIEPEVKNKIMDEIKNNIFNRINNMYGDQDISYIECIIKFNTRDEGAEETIFHEAASKYSVQYRGMKRSMPAPSEIPAKMARRSPQPDMKLGSNLKPAGTIRRAHGHTKRQKEIFNPDEPPSLHRMETRSSMYIIPPPTPSKKRSNAKKKAASQFSYELNPLMSRMIDVELQDVMVKVWQALPDEPKSDAEKLVADKLRTDIGDTFRNVLGLNVAKRLLNIFNKLILRIQFSVMPPQVNLRAFLKKYSFVSFKRMVGSTRSFYAQVKTIQDFDRLCTAKDLYCGSSRVFVTPHYKFVQRPDKLKATFNQSSAEKPKTDVTTEKDDKETPKDVNPVQENKKEEPKPVVTTVSTTQVKPVTTNAQSKPTTVKPTTQTVSNISKTTQNAKETKANEVTPVQTNGAANSTATKANTPVNATTPAKTTQAKPNTPITATQNKPSTTTATQNKQNTTTVTQHKPTTTTATQNKPTTTTATQNKPSTPTTATQNKQSTSAVTQKKPNTQTTPQNKPANKATPAKSAPSTKPKDQTKPTPKGQIKTKTVTKAKVTPTKAQEAKKKSPNVKTKKDPLQGKGDFEELDDHDILALMSGGIVLDECSGSDEE